METELARTLEPAEVVAKGICPVKKEFLKTAVSRKLVPVVLGTAEAVAAKEANVPVQKMSKNKQKKAKKEQKLASVCFKFIKGVCAFGDKCKFSHDLTALFQQRPADLPGRCPFYHKPACPYGVMCRWATSHPNVDPITQQYLEFKKSGEGTKDDGSKDAGSVETGSAAPVVETVELPISETFDQTMNELDHSIQHSLRKNTYDFSRANATLAALKIEACPVRKPKGDAADATPAAAAATQAAAPQTAGASQPAASASGQADAGAKEGGADGATLLAADGEQLSARPLEQAGAAPGGAEGASPAAAGGVQLPERALAQASGAGAGGEPGCEDAAASEPAQAGTERAASAEAEAVAQVQAASAQATGSAHGGAQRESAADGASASTKRPLTDVEPSADAAHAVSGSTEPDSKRLRADAGTTANDSVPAASTSGRQEADERSPIPLYDISASTHANGDCARLRPAEKKRLDFRGKLYLAPLTTCGNLPFRRVCKGLGCDITCGEMAMASNLLQGQSSEWALVKRHPCEDVFGVQICCSYADTTARCCQVLDDTIQVDFVDLNVGCPIDLVCSKGAGSGLLLKPKRLEQIVRASAAVLSCPLTFKTRTAYFDRQLVAHDILPHAASWGAYAVTLHGRTRQQRYHRDADWQYIDQVLDVMPAGFPVIGNGDVFSWEDYQAHMASGKLATCMIARGALIKPWIFTEIKEKRHWDISAGERLDLLKNFCRFGLEHWGSDAKGIENVRRFLLEWLSYLHRYVPVGLLEVLPQKMSLRPPAYFGRSDLETLLSSPNASDWVKISEMLLGPTPAGFQFAPKHRSNSYATEGDMERAADADENG